MSKLVIFVATVCFWPAPLPSRAASAPPSSSAQSHYERPSTQGGHYQKRVVIFVHGIYGDADSTWRYSPTVYWPRLLLTDEMFRDSDIYVASYSSPRFGNTMNLDEVVSNLNNRLVNDEVFSKHREVVFVCHSLGGLIVQRLLLTFRNYAQQVPFIYFFSTPETGAQIAKLAAVFSSDPLLGALNSDAENEDLQNLENEWKAARFHIHRFCAYEKKKYRGVLVVDRLSGTRNCDDPPLPINEDHVSIVKPDGVNHDSYVALRNAFKEYPVDTGKPADYGIHIDTSPPLQRTAKFAVMIPFNTAPDSSPIPIDENPDDPLSGTYGELGSLAMNGQIPDAAREAPDDGQREIHLETVSMDAAPIFLRNLLQYYIFKSINDLQSDSLSVFVGAPARPNAGIEPPDAEKYPYDKLYKQLANNVYFRPFRNSRTRDKINESNGRSVRMPKGTEIDFLQTSQPDRCLVRLQRPHYYKAEFIVESFLGTGVGQVPRNFATQYVSTTMQWTFFVTMRYSIQHPADETFNPNRYAQWLDALYDGLDKRLSAE